MSEKPFFSIVIPVYNKGPHVRRAISSVLNQTFQGFELILVNDASTDNSLEEMQKFTDPRICILHRDEPSVGGYAARNLGIKEAQAEWIAFLDADDEWFPEHLEKMMFLSENYPEAGFLGCGWIADNGKTQRNNKFYERKKNHSNLLINTSEYLSTVSRGVNIIHTDVSILKRDVLKHIAGFPEPSVNCQRAGDGQTWLRVMLSGESLAWSSHIGAVRYENAENMMSKNKLYKINENCIFTYISYILQKERNVKFSPLLKKYRTEIELSWIFQKTRTGEIRLSDLNKALFLRVNDRRTILIALGVVAPKLTKTLISLKTEK